MPDILRIGLSALLTHQRALATTSNNIANATTPGYSRQRTELAERPAERIGSYSVGSGVQIQSVRRMSDDIIADQLRGASGAYHRAATFADLASSVDNLFADSNTGLNLTLQSFMNAVQDLADDPSSTAARQALLSEARNLTSRFDTMDRRLSAVGEELGARLGTATAKITALGQELAKLNGDIINAGNGNGSAPPDLLDRRDLLLEELATLVQVDAVEQRDGSMAVFVGSGQPLVLGTTATALALVPGSLDPAEPQIVMRGSGPEIDLTRFLTGGELGGLLDFNREMLAPARAELGRIAVGLTHAVNTAHRNGMDALGQLGGDLLAVEAPRSYEGAGNTGTGALSVSIADVGALQAASYRLSYDGTSYTLLRADTGAVVPLTGTGTAGDPLVADGLSIVVSGTPAAGDQFMVKALEHVADTMSVLVSDPARVAAAAPIRTSAALDNAGNATISSGTVVDVTDANLLATTTIEFLTPTTYSVNGAGSFAYTSGGDIVVNGASVRISGTPAAGDQFVISSNAGGVGDNRNALALAAALGGGVLEGGNLSLQSAASGLVTSIGTRSAEAESQSEAQRVVVGSTRDRLDSIRGVNLDEEAAEMLKLEQMYQAAARMISVADELFDSLLYALR